jgi:hypothetical protein
MYALFAPSRLGYNIRTVVERTLMGRALLAWRTDPDLVRNALRKHGVSYQIETARQLMHFVAFLDKPFAEILDDIGVPRERFVNEFIEFEGPLPYNPSRCVIRRVVPGLIPASEIKVQPLANPTNLIATLRMLTDNMPQLDTLLSLSPKQDKS